MPGYFGEIVESGETPEIEAVPAFSFNNGCLFWEIMWNKNRIRSHVTSRFPSQASWEMYWGWAPCLFWKSFAFSYGSDIAPYWTQRRPSREESWQLESLLALSVNELGKSVSLCVSTPQSGACGRSYLPEVTVGNDFRDFYACAHAAFIERRGRGVDGAIRWFSQRVAADAYYGRNWKRDYQQPCQCSGRGCTIGGIYFTNEQLVTSHVLVSDIPLAYQDI